jgi:glycosyltransferase involved in cell wall biosynthesis
MFCLQSIFLALYHFSFYSILLQQQVTYTGSFSCYKIGDDPIKKLLVVTYAWPPLGGSGVQRWLKFVKYLPHHDWTPYVLTPSNPAFTLKDESLEKDVPVVTTVIRRPIWEPYGIFLKLFGKYLGKEQSNNVKGFVPDNTSLPKKIVSWIRGNLFIPDPRIFWVRPSVRFLKKYLRRQKINTLVTTGPPHSMHLIGLKLIKGNRSLRWIADFRDPWSQWGFFDSVYCGKIARKIHKSLEKKVLESAHELTTVTPFYQRQLQEISGRHVHLITNGYDCEDFEALKMEKTEKFVIRHVGFISETRNPQPLMLALSELLSERKSLANLIRVDFVGEVHPLFKEPYSTCKELSAVITYTPSVPHKEIIHKYASTSLLLLILSGYKDAEGYLTGKIFEYIATGLPILGIGPENGDAAELLQATKAGIMFDPSNIKGIKNYILDKFNIWKNSGVSNQFNSNLSMYSRKELTARLVEILEINQN